MLIGCFGRAALKLRFGGDTQHGARNLPYLSLPRSSNSRDLRPRILIKELVSLVVKLVVFTLTRPTPSIK